MTLLHQFGRSKIYNLDSSECGSVTSLAGISGLEIDSDGDPRSYAPPGSGLHALDVLADGGYPRSWYGGPTQNGRWIIQGAGDPAPGYIVSSTSWEQGDVTKQASYVPASAVPYLVIPERSGLCKMGTIGIAFYGHRSSAFVVADTGPSNRFGEGSIKLADNLGIPSSPISGGTDFDVYTLLFVNHQLPFGLWDQLASIASGIFAVWGGETLADQVIEELRA